MTKKAQEECGGKGYNTGTTEWIFFNLEPAQIEIANQKY